MKHTIGIAGILILLIFVSPLFGAVHISVPLDHEVYRILENAEIRGLIDTQPSVKPYNASTILKLLQQIQNHPGDMRPSERDEVARILANLRLIYGVQPSGFEDVLSTGFFRTYDDEKQMGASMGANFSSFQTVSAKTREYDSRNVVLAFMRGDLGPNISFNMDFGLALDRLNSNVFIPTEFTIPGEGFYMQLIGGTSQLRDIPSDGFYFGLTLSPEVAASFFNDSLRLRWGSIKRDWGPGLNNLLVSGSARSFDGIDIQAKLTPWLSYSVVNGSLGKFSLDTLDDEPFFSDDFQQDKPYYRFDNNFSAHRVDVDFTKNLRISIFESTVWQKRFELGYLNPLAIYMFQQNNLGDIDDVIAGLDFSYTLPTKVRVYGAVATSEMNVLSDPLTMLKAARNMLAFQAGVVVPLPIGTFSSLTVQWTYLAPFFYAHYPIMEYGGFVSSTENPTTSIQGNTYTLKDDGIEYKPRASNTSELISLPASKKKPKFSEDGRIKIVKEGDNLYHIYETVAETAYVNKGENLGYPLNPNSQEFLLQLDLGFPKGWTAQFQTKYQVRSGQYGYSIEQFMDYSDDENYEPKAFWDNTFMHTLSVLLKASKKFENMPIELIGSYRFTSVWEKPVDAEGDFDGRTTMFGDWSTPVFDHIVQVGAKIFF